MRCRTIGPSGALIAAVGEAPGAQEEASGLPFVGSAGYQLDTLLKDAGLHREHIFITNVTHDRPPNNEIEQWIGKATKKPPTPEGWVWFRGRWVTPHIQAECERLYGELRSVSPNVVVAFGNSPLWALCGHDSISKWRGSHLISDAIPGLKVIPTYHPAFILRSFDKRDITVQDLRRVKRESVTPLDRKPQRSFGMGPSFREACEWLRDLLARLSTSPVPFTCDLEIIAREILCVGIGLSPTSAFCIPFLCLKGQYWPNVGERMQIIQLLLQCLTHPNARVVNQNLSFDIQYLFWRLFIRPRAHFDTMIAQNLLFPGLPKDLAYIASMHCDHYVYWKDDGKFWISYESDEKLWEYNCLDCTYTFESYLSQQEAITSLSLTPQMAFQMKTFENLMGMMLRGVRVDEGMKSILLKEIQSLSTTLQEEVRYLAQHSLTGEKGGYSPKKMAHFFYKTLALQAIHKKGGGVTCDDEALKKIALRNPWLRPLTERINMVRSYGTAEDVCRKRTDHDGRWRTSYNVAGTSTFRLASSENPLDSGLNLQNLTIGRDILK